MTFWTVDSRGQETTLRPSPDADFSNIRLGMAVMPNVHDMYNTYSMVARRGGVKLWQLDFDDEADCEAEAEAFRPAIVFYSGVGSSNADINSIFYLNGNGLRTAARHLTQFDASTGAVTHDIDLAALKQLASDAEALTSKPEFGARMADLMNHGVSVEKLTADAESGEIRRERVSPMAIRKCGDIPEGFAPLKFTSPNVERWEVVDGQVELHVQDFVVRRQDGLIENVSASNATHIFIGMKDGFALVSPCGSGNTFVDCEISRPSQEPLSIRDHVLQSAQEGGE